MTAANEAPNLVGRNVVAGEDRNHARRLESGRYVDFVDRRVGVRRAQKISVCLAGAVDVVDVAALAGNEADVFCAFDGGADSCHAHDVSLPWDNVEVSCYSAALGVAAALISRAPWATAFTMLW